MARKTVLYDSCTASRRMYGTVIVFYVILLLYRETRVESVKLNAKKSRTEVSCPKRTITETLKINISSSIDRIVFLSITKNCTRSFSRTITITKLSHSIDDMSNIQQEP